MCSRRGRETCAEQWRPGWRRRHRREGNLENQKGPTMFLNDDRRDEFLSLSATGMPGEAVRRLEALGITTLEELRDTWTYGNRQLLTDYLGESPVRFTMVRPSAALTRGAASSGPGNSVNLLGSGPVRPLVRHARGLALSSTQVKRRAEAPEPVALGGSRGAKSAGTKVVSLINRFPAVRHQGQRGTCVAFASMAYLEFHLANGSARNPRRSEQFFYWACKAVEGTTNEGTTLAMAQGLQEARGVPERDLEISFHADYLEREAGAAAGRGRGRGEKDDVVGGEGAEAAG